MGHGGPSKGDSHFGCDGFALTKTKYCITRIFRVEEIFAIFANLDFARNFPPANVSSARKYNTNSAKK